jgi:beta-galactosidase
LSLHIRYLWHRTVCITALFACTLSVPAQNSSSPILLGAAWYPEQWPESRWDADLQLMQDAHLHVVRVGEFAWSAMEPSEGHFDFIWLDHALALAAKHHIAIVLSTPTAAPPAWLTTKYPETLLVDENGKRDEHGNRQQFSFTNPRYREFSHRIALEMAKRYGHNPNVLGWQIDNELARDSFDPTAKQQFHAWLQHKYGTVAELNRLWTTSYWSQTYDNFDEIPVRPAEENPALLLDWRHFVTDTWVSYLQNQIDAIRPNADTHQFITTNTMHWFNQFDHYILHKNLDIAAWDDYFPDGHLDPALNGILHDLVRGYKRQNFWVMETQPAFVNWGPVNAALPPGVTREMAWQAIGHGADAVLYWQWRSALNGQEQYHGTLVGADGTPVPVYKEIQRLGADFDRIGTALSGTTVTSPVAILQSYDSHWAIDFQKHSQKFDYQDALTDYYRALRPIAQSIDVISPDAPLTGYKAVFAPALNVLPEATAKHLIEYVQQGGNLVLGDRSGMKDAWDGLQPNRQPGPLADVLGGRVEQFYALDKPVPLSGAWGSGTASIWAEYLSAKSSDVKVLMTYGKSNSWLDDKPAVINRVVGKGSITYIGASLDLALMQNMAVDLLKQFGVTALLPNLPADVELMPRSNGNSHIWILINHGSTAQHIPLPREMTDLLATSAAARSSIDIQPHDVAVLKADVSQ